MKKALLLFVLACFSVGLKAQDATTEGTQFWLSFMQNGYYENTQGTGVIPDGAIPQITISAKRQCTGHLSNPNFPEWSEMFVVAANGIEQLNIPKEYCYHHGTDNETIANKGIHIKSTDTISVYCANIANNSFDASFVLPLAGLGSDYIIQCGEQSTVSTSSFENYKRENQTSAFLIVATEDNTTVNITPSVSTLGNQAAGTTFQVRLNTGQTYHVRSNNDASSSSGRDLSGTRVTADDCKKIAVFNGNTLTRIPTTNSGSSGFDHVFEQAMPLHSWGRRFVVTQSMTRTRDMVKIISSADGNEIRRNGTIVATLNANETYNFYLTANEGSCYIEASHTCAVYLYNTSAFDNKASGDPSMVWISPIEQKISDITFATFTHNQATIDNHYVNIIVSSDDTGQVYLDGNNIPSGNFSRVNGNDEYSYTRQSISHGTHRLTCAHGFNAHVYGFGNAKGYAYMAGSKAADLTTLLNVDGIDVTDGDTVGNCSLDPIVFKAELNYSNYNITWDFGDGTTSHSTTAQHTYPDNSIYEATFTVHTNEMPCIQSDELSIRFYIDTRREADEEYSADACIGIPYSGYGFENVEINGDTILIREKGLDLPEHCRGSVIVHVTAHQQGYNGPYEELLCFTGPGVFEKYGVSIAYDHPGNYDTIALLPAEFGCESMTEIHLTVVDVTDHEPDIVTECHSYTWQNGVTYLESVSIDDTIPDLETGCYEIKHLRLRILHSPDSCAIVAKGQTTAPWVVPGNEFQLNAYHFFLDSLVADYGYYDSVSWQLCRRNPAGQLVESGLNWRLSIAGEKHERCTVYPFNHTNDTVWLQATAYNPCANEGVKHLYWMVCSFYGIGENEGTTPSFSIVPNPNNGSMELHFERFDGTAEVKVYDIRGSLIDTFSTDSAVVPYDLRGKSDGIYFFVATDRHGTVARKVVTAK